MSESTSKPRGLRRDARENRARILEATPLVLSELGPEAPMEAIAQRAGVGVGTLYRRFPNREALMGALLEAETERLASWAREAAAGDAAAALPTFLERALQTPMADLVVRQLVLSRTAPEQREARLLGVLLPAVTALVTRAQEAGAIRADFAPTDIPLLVLGIASIARETRGVSENAWRRILGIFLDGLRPAAATPLPAPLQPEQLRAMITQFGGTGG